ncbi:MAG: GIY-YIG nuclease family protein [Candidatus Omnitrophota bacterium]|nr:GIY-YIG nuclease family protein [Candidatus Omnitrophota bacterium]
MNYPQTLKEKILSAYESPGVYLIRDAAGVVQYVGKAKNLKKRLLSYLRTDLSRKTAALMQKAQDVELKLCASEDLALLLEASLIRQLKPRYNVSLRDDKSFPFVKISGGDFPAIYITRKKDDLGGSYIGPYTNAKLLKNALKIIRSSGFAYRSCKRMPKRSCVYHKINLCPACCIGAISVKEYARNIDNIILILNGKTDLLIRNLTSSMQDRSRVLDFEAAARLRDQITVLSESLGVSGPRGVNRKKESEDLRNKLGLSKLPIRIEGFDISNISGNQAVGSMVSFYNGAPDKNNYRRFRIKTVCGIDDYKMLAEVVRRRYSRILKEKGVLPDLLLIDGGKGQLQTAVKQLEYLHLKLPVVSIAKKNEYIYSSCKSRHLKFLEDTPAINLIRRVRDEAHRFALAYHQLLRKRALIGG